MTVIPNPRYCRINGGEKGGGGGKVCVPDEKTDMRCVVIDMEELWLVVGICSARRVWPLSEFPAEGREESPSLAHQSSHHQYLTEYGGLSNHAVGLEHIVVTVSLLNLCMITVASSIGAVKSDGLLVECAPANEAHRHFLVAFEPLAIGVLCPPWLQLQ